MILALVLSLGLNVFANTRDQKRAIYNINKLISDELRFTTATPDELDQAQEHLEKALDLLKFGSQQVSGKYVCVSRDNDNRAPYAMAFRDANYQTHKLNLIFNSVQDCEKGISEMVKFRNFSLMCSSRDLDGRAPYSIFKINNTTSSKLSVVYDSVDGCYQAINDAVTTSDYIVLCSSRDSDGRAPWSMYRVKIADGSVDKLKTIYTDYQSCKAAL